VLVFSWLLCLVWKLCHVSGRPILPRRICFFVVCLRALSIGIFLLCRRNFPDEVFDYWW
jgi:hypothetical protein